MKKKGMPDREIAKRAPATKDYDELLLGVVELLEAGRRQAARAVHSVLTSTYWLVGRRLIEHEQKGHSRAPYGAELLKRLSKDLQQRLGRGFSERNLEQMRQFFLLWPKSQTLSAASVAPQRSDFADTVCEIRHPDPAQLSTCLGLTTFAFCPFLTLRLAGHYETEALRGGWSVRQLDRQIATLAYQRSGSRRLPAGLSPPVTTADTEIKDPFVLEFLGLKDEYSESELEDALIRELEQFLLELGNDFAFVARQKRLRVGTEWYRVDLLFFHRRLRSLIVVELKLGKFTHADAGQMNLYLNYAREHWTNAEENPPIGLILCSEHDAAVAHYALGNLGNQVLAREYQLTLPQEHQLTQRLEVRRRQLESRGAVKQLPS